MTVIEEIRLLQSLPSPARAKAIREAAGLSQERLAQALGVHRVTLTRWETGVRLPRGATRLKYAAVLNQIRQELLN